RRAQLAFPPPRSRRRARRGAPLSRRGCHARLQSRVAVVSPRRPQGRDNQPETARPACQAGPGGVASMAATNSLSAAGKEGAPVSQAELRTLDEGEDGGAPSHGALVFPELIWKHYCWQHALHPERYGKSRNGHGAQNGNVRQLYNSYRRSLDRFEEDAGPI